MATHINDAKFEALATLTGVRTDINDMEWRWLYSIVAPRIGTIQDMWRWALEDSGFNSQIEMLEATVGYPSNINDLWLDYWLNYPGAGIGSNRIAGNNLMTMVGDSRPGQSLITGNLGNVGNGGTWLAQLSQKRLQLSPANIFSGSGESPATIRATRFPSALATTAKVLLLICGINQGASLAQDIADISYMANTWVESASDRVAWVMDEFCPDTTMSGAITAGYTAGSAKMTRHVALRDAIRAMSRPSAGIFIVPSWQASTGGNDGQVALSSFYRPTDGIHNGPYGGYLLGSAMETNTTLMDSVPEFDAYADRIFCADQTLNGQNFVAGTFATNGLSLSGTGHTAVGVSDLDGDGIQWAQVTLNGTASVQLTRSSGPLPADITPGQTVVRAIIKWRAANLVNVRGFAFDKIKQAGTNFGVREGVDNGSGTELGDIPITLDYGTFLTEPIVVPADANSLRWRLIMSPKRVSGVDQTMTGSFSIAYAGIIIEPREVLVTDQTTLNAAITDIKAGDIIKVAANATSYSLDLTSVNPAQTVRIESADPGNWASFTQVKLTSCSKLHLKYFALYRDPIAYGGADFNMLHFINSSDITIQGLYAYGSATAYYTSPEDRGNTFARLEGCTRVAFDGEYVFNEGGPGQATNLGWGFRIFSSTFVTLKNYKIEQFQFDGLQLSGVVEDILFDKCVIGNPLGSDYAENHGDLFQFTNSGAVSASKRITIRDCIFAVLDKTNQQGIFFNNEAAIRTEDVTIQRCLVQQHSDNALLIRAFDGVMIEENIVIDAPNATAATGATVNSAKFQADLVTASGSIDLTVRNNLAETYTNIPSNGSTANGMTASGNVVVADRQAYLPGVNSMTSLLEMEALTMPAGYGPLHMR